MNLVGVDRPRIVTRRNAFCHMVNLYVTTQYAPAKGQPLYLFSVEQSDSKSIAPSKSLAFGDSENCQGPRILTYTKSMPFILNKNTNTNLGLMNRKNDRAVGEYFTHESRLLNMLGSVWVVDRPITAVMIKVEGETQHNQNGLFSNKCDILPVFPKNVGYVTVGNFHAPPVQVTITPTFAITDYMS